MRSSICTAVFVNALNARGGNAHYVWTKEKGIRGNTHFLFHGYQ